MLKQLKNQARVKVRIEPVDPLLIKSGQATVGGTDMTFVRTYRSGEAEPYLPGSSLKGVIRSYCEKICRSLRPENLPVCLPYIGPDKQDISSDERKQISCGLNLTKWEKQTNKNVSSCEAFNVSCPACRMFGSLKFTGRCSVSDAYALNKPLLEKRDGVAIDRVTGGAASGAKYDLEVLTKGSFEANIDIRNFERWQLGLLGLVLRDMRDGLVRLGSAKSRGLGRFTAEISSFSVEYYNWEPTSLVGLYVQSSDEERKRYGFFLELENQNSKLGQFHRKGLRYVCDITKDWEEILEPGVQDFLEYVKAVKWPEKLNQFVQRR